MFYVSEIFGPTIQGEGLHAGRPCLFLRFARCNLWRDPNIPSVTCPWCDTPQLHKGTEMTLKEIVNKLCALGMTMHVSGVPIYGLVITGGEPLLQVTEEMLRVLHPFFAWIDIETNGSVKPKFPEDLDLLEEGRGVFISCSPKLPRLQKVVVKPSWWKILIPDKNPLLKQLLEYPVSRSKIYLQPIEPLNQGGKIDSEKYKENVREVVTLSFQTGCNVCIQLHKHLRLP